MTVRELVRDLLAECGREKVGRDLCRMMEYNEVANKPIAEINLNGWALIPVKYIPIQKENE